MIGTKLISGRNQPGIAEQARDQLVSAVGSAGDTVRSAKQRTASLADSAGSRVGSVADEAWIRANAAMGALVGRRPGLPWAWIVGAGLVGVAIGWAAGMVGQAAISRAVEEDGMVSQAAISQALDEDGMVSQAAISRALEEDGNPQLTEKIEIVDVDRPPGNPNGGR